MLKPEEAVLVKGQAMMKKQGVHKKRKRLKRTGKKKRIVTAVLAALPAAAAVVITVLATMYFSGRAKILASAEREARRQGF